MQVTLAGGGTGTAVTVNAGVAIDSTGREIVLPADTNLEVGGEAVGTLFITITYDEQQSDPTTEAGGPGNTRVTELPKPSFSTASPTDASMTLILARSPANRATGLGAVDGSDRKQAGVVLGDNLYNQCAYTKEGRDCSSQLAGAELRCSESSRILSGSLIVGGSVGIGAGTPESQLEHQWVRYCGVPMPTSKMAAMKCFSESIQ